jgi:hypothetical protein
MKKSENQQPSKDKTYEFKEIETKHLIRFGIGLIVSVGVIMFIMYGMFQKFHQKRFLQDQKEVSNLNLFSLTQGKPSFKGPQLQISPVQELKVFRNYEEAFLNSYGWVDQKSGIVRIPIERGMELFLKANSSINPIPIPSNKTPLDMIQERSVTLSKEN